MQNSVGQNQIPQTTAYAKPVQPVVVQEQATQLSASQNNVPQQINTQQVPAIQQAVNAGPQQAQVNYSSIPQASAFPPQGQIYPQAQGQSVQVPNYSGVNIQIFNPSVTPPGANAPVYNVNAPSYQMGNSQPQSYPANYYTKPLAKNDYLGNANNSNTTTNTTTTTTNVNESKKTEKRKVVQLTDDYIRNLENYLNSQDKELRYMGAKEVVARLEEDESRKDDKALNALINKMLQDPYSKVKFLAMAALQSRMATGDPLTVQLLTNIQNASSGYGQDSLMASDILLKMSGQTVEKEFEVKNTTKTDKK